MKTNRWIPGFLVMLSLVLLAAAGITQPETIPPVLNALLMIGLGLGLGLLLASRWKLSWGLYGAGALTFILSQVLHIPFNSNLLNPLIARIAPEATPGSAQLALAALLLGLSAGVFEETARYLVLRFWRKDVTTWKKSLMFGAGHGGIEAIILGVLAFVAFLQISYYTRIGTDALQSTMDPAQFEALTATISGYWGNAWYVHLLGAAERLFVLPVHVAATVLVFRAVHRRKFGWYLAAVGWHTLVDFAAVFASRTWGIYPTEGIILVLGLLSVGIIFALREADPVEPETPLGEGSPIISPAPDSLPLNPVQDKPITKESLEDSRYD